MTLPFPRPDLDLVLFDMDDVLLRYDVPARIAALAGATGRPGASIRAALWASDYFPRADSGEWDAQGCLDEFSARIGVAVSRRTWIDTRRAGMTPFPDMFELLSLLRQSGVSVGLMSNNDLLTLEELGALAPGLPELLGANAFVSAQFRMLKPDPRLYRMVCERIGALPGRTMFVDDVVENVEGARAAGLYGHIFAGRAGLEAAFAMVGQGAEA